MYSSMLQNSSVSDNSKKVSRSGTYRLYKFKAHHTFLNMSQHNHCTTVPSVFVERFMSSSNYINADESSVEVQEAGMTFCELFSKCLALQQEVFAISHYFAQDDCKLSVIENKAQKEEHRKEYEQYVNVLSKLNRLSFKTRPLHATAALAACFALPPIVALHSINERINNTMVACDEKESAASIDLCAQFDCFVPLEHLLQSSLSISECSQKSERLIWHWLSRMPFSIYKSYLATLTTLLFDTTVSSEGHRTFLPVHPRFTLEEYMHRITHQQYTTAYGYSVSTWNEEILWRLLISLVSVLALVHSVNLHFNGQITATDVICFVAKPTLSEELIDTAVSIRDTFGCNAVNSDEVDHSNTYKLSSSGSSHGNSMNSRIHDEEEEHGTNINTNNNNTKSNNKYNDRIYTNSVEGMAVEDQVWSMYMRTAASSVILPHVFITAETAPQHTFFVLTSLMSAFTQVQSVNTERSKEQLLKCQRNDLIAVGRLLSKVINTICNANNKQNQMETHENTHQHGHEINASAHFSSELLFIIKRLQSDEEEQNNLPTALQLSHLHAFTLRTQLWLNALLAEESHLRLRGMWEQHKLSSAVLTSHEKEHMEKKEKETNAKLQEDANKSYDILEQTKQLKEECEVKMAIREQELAQKEEMLALREEQLVQSEKKLSALLSLYDLTYKHLEELKLPVELDSTHLAELQNRFMSELRKGNYNTNTCTDDEATTSNESHKNDANTVEHIHSYGEEDRLIETEVQADYVNDDSHCCLTTIHNKNNNDNNSHGNSHNDVAINNNNCNKNDSSMPTNDNNEIDFTTPLKSILASMTNDKEQKIYNFIDGELQNQDRDINVTKNNSAHVNNNKNNIDVEKSTIEAQNIDDNFPHIIANAELCTPVQQQHHNHNHHRLRRSPKIRMTEPNWMENQMQELDEIESCLTSDEKRTPQSLMQSPYYDNNTQIDYHHHNNSSSHNANVTGDSNNSGSKMLNRNAHRLSHTAPSAIKSLFGTSLPDYECHDHIINETSENVIAVQCNNTSQQELEHQWKNEERRHNNIDVSVEYVSTSNNHKQKSLISGQPQNLHYLQRTPDKQKYRTGANLCNVHTNKISNEVNRTSNNYVATNKGNNKSFNYHNNTISVNKSGRNSVTHAPNTFTVRTSYVTPRSARSVRVNNFNDANNKPTFAASATNFRRSMTTNTFHSYNDKWRRPSHINNSHKATVRNNSFSHGTFLQNKTSVTTNNKRTINNTHSNNSFNDKNSNHYINIDKYVKSGVDVEGMQKWSFKSRSNNMLCSDQHQSSTSTSPIVTNMRASSSSSSSLASSPESTTRSSAKTAAKVAKEMLEKLRGSVTMKT